MEDVTTTPQNKFMAKNRNRNWKSAAFNELVDDAKQMLVEKMHELIRRRRRRR